MPQLICKRCGIGRIVALDLVQCTQAILDWERDAEGNLKPADFGETKVFYESSTPQREDEPYECNHCLEPYDKHALEGCKCEA